MCNHIQIIQRLICSSLIQPLLIDQVYIDRKNEVIKAERRILKELGFCVYVKHPHKVISYFSDPINLTWLFFVYR